MTNNNMANMANGTNGALSNGHPSSWQAKHDLPPHFIGGNYLDSAPASAVKDFVQKSDGHSVITSVSIAQLSRLRTCH
jgi:acetyl-CoA carboxylase / biotin carboxylase 1